MQHLKEKIGNNIVFYDGQKDELKGVYNGHGIKIKISSDGQTISLQSDL